MAATSVVRDFFVPFVGFAVLLYAVFCCLSLFAIYTASVTVIASLLFLFKFALPRMEESCLEEFLLNSGLSPAEVRPVFIISHRTTALEAPENSIAGIREAKENGFHSVEFDVQCTKDGVPVLFHDATVDRTTDGVGRVDQLTLEDLKKLDISAKHLQHDKFRHETVATLDEAVEECERLQLKMFIDVKAPDSSILLQLLKLFKNKKHVLKHVMVVCWSPLFLYQIRKAEPSLLTGLVWRPRMVSSMTSTGLLECAYQKYAEKWKRLLASVADVLLDWTYRWLLWYPCGVSTLLAHKDAISKEFLRFWNSRGVRVLAWPVNDPLEKQYFTSVLKVGGYLTDTYLPKP